MFKKIPEFALVTCRVLAQRLQQSSRTMLPPADKKKISPDPNVLSFLPWTSFTGTASFRLKIEDNVLYLGFVEDRRRM